MLTEMNSSSGCCSKLFRNFSRSWSACVETNSSARLCRTSAPLLHSEFNSKDTVQQVRAFSVELAVHGQS